MHAHVYEKVWIAAAILFILAFVGSIVATTAAQLASPASHMEVIDPAAVQSQKGWTPGTVVLPDGTLQVTATARIWTFDPNRIELPAGRKVRFRITSADVLHGFEIPGTNVNTMVVPGYVSQLTTVFTKPGKYLLLCNEYCGIGHHNMSAEIVVTEEAP